MRILLLGEYSALHKNLKEGLVELGHDVTLASYGDGYKKIPADIRLNSELGGIKGKVHNRLKPFFLLPSLSNYDVVQIINPFIFNIRFMPKKILVDYIIKNNKKTYLLAAGSDAFFWKFGKERLSYGPFDDTLKYDIKADSVHFMSEKSFLYNKRLSKKVDGIIPVMYEYEVSYMHHPNKKRTIPIPMNTEKIPYTTNKFEEKIIIFHGLSRYGFKGTRHVEKAFEYLEKKYSDSAEFIIDGNMPLDKYLELMKKTNIIVDQVYSHSLGVNGIYALAMGKVVLGGAEPKSLKSLGVRKSPVINIKPNEKSIIEEISKIIDNPECIEVLGEQGRRFAVEVHGHVEVAKKYLEIWGN